jgi:formylglycine-generating enzyme required for sulfatase activity
MDQTMSDFLTKLAANLTGHMILAAGKKIRDSFRDPVREQALERCMKQALLAVYEVAACNTGEDARLLNDLFHPLFDRQDVAKTLASLLKGERLDRGKMRSAFDENSLQGIELDTAASAFETAFAEAADKEEALQGEIQTRLQREILGKMREPEGEARLLRESYLSWLFEGCRKLSLAGIDPKSASEASASLDLDAVYTALRTTTPEIHERLEKREPVMDRETRHLSALEQLNLNPHLVLLGDPGSGKSTFVNFVALCLSGEGLKRADANLALLTAPLPDEKDAEDKKKRKKQPWDHGALLPVKVVLRDLAARGLPPAGGKAAACHLWRFIQSELETHEHGEFARHLKKELKEKGGLLLLDGLDEVPEAERRREQIKQAVEDFRAAYSKCRILATSRTYAYQKQDWKLDGFAETVLAPFTKGQIMRFVDGWYTHVGKLRFWHRDDSTGRAALLKRAIESNKSLQALAERPLLLTLMASLHAWRGGTLPERREQLYADTVDLLLDWWESPKAVRVTDGTMKISQPGLVEWLRADRNKIREFLNELAFEVHAAQPDLQGTADIPEGELVAGLLQLTDDADTKHKRLLEYLSRRAGLLLPRGVRVYTFPHRTFQEYLAACHLTDCDFPEKVADLAKQQPDRWREVALLAAAKAARGSASSLWTFVEELCHRDVGAKESGMKDLWGAHLAAQALVETADLTKISDRNRPKLERVTNWLVHILAQNDFPVLERTTAGNNLARLGDPRPEVMTVDKMQFCLVPAGPFWMGEGSGLNLNKNLNYDFWISRFPVTVAQFKIFKADFRYEGPSNHPAVDITWYEARDFCKWLTEKWRRDGLLAQGWIVALPSEAEWEKAARGGVKIPQEWMNADVAGLNLSGNISLKTNPEPKRRFPWGEKADPNRANYRDTGIRSTSSVGCFSGGVSPYGCQEMSGNVWEWTRDASEENLRVLRGGSFYNGRDGVRCAFRYRSYPDIRDDDFGFRCVLSPSKNL